MRLGNVLLVAGRELRELLRDRRTLTYVLLIPPMTIFLIAMAGSIAAKRALQRDTGQPVTVAVEPGTVERYERLAHEAFLQSSVGREVRPERGGGLLSRLLPTNSMLLSLSDAPPDLGSSAASYGEWLRKLGTEQLAAGKPMVTSEDEPSTKTAEGNRSFLARSQKTAIEGFGLVTFVPSDSLTSGTTTRRPVPELLKSHPHGVDIAAALERGEIQAWLSIDGDVDAALKAPYPALALKLVANTNRTESVTTRNRINNLLKDAEKALVRTRLERAGLPAEKTLEPFRWNTRSDVAGKNLEARRSIAGMIPYLLVLFVYVGAIFPAIDMAAGEKERATLETLLLSPASRWEIASGKYLIVLMASLTTVLLGLIASGIAIKAFVPSLALDFLGIKPSLSLGVFLFVATIPIAAIFSGLFLGVSLVARSFKEAQNYLAPVGLFLVIPPAAASFLWPQAPLYTALIPVVNVSLATRDQVTGSAEPLYLAVTLASALVSAALSVWFMAWQFSRESVIFRS